MSLYRRPGSPFWWSKLYVAGDVVRFSTRERTKGKALVAEREEAKRLSEQASRVREGRYTLATLGAKVLDWKEEQARAKGREPSGQTYRMREKHLAVILAHFGGERDVRTVTQDDLEAFRAARMESVAAVTVAKELSTLRQMLKYAARVAKVIPTAPEIHNPEVHYTAAAWRILSREELDRLLSALSATRSREVLPWALLRANTGLRPTEATKLEWTMVDFRAGTLELPGRITKGRRARSVPLSPGAWEALWMLAIRRGPGPAIGRLFAEENHYTAWHTARDAAGLGKVRPHDLRHTLASYLHGDGVPLAVVRDILGHLTLDMVNRYAHTFSRDRADALAAVTVSVPVGVPSGGSSVPDLGAKGSGAGGGARRGSATRK